MKNFKTILITITAITMLFEPLAFADGSFVYGAGTGPGAGAGGSAGLPEELKKPVRVLYVKNKKGKWIEYGRAAKHKSEGYSVFQGSCTDGSATYHVLYNKKPAHRNMCRLIKVDPKTKKVTRVSRAYRIYHGNDMAYDSKRKRLVVVHGDGDTKKISVFDPDTLKRRKVVRLGFNRAIKGISRSSARRIKGVTGIAYDEKHDRFICSVKSTFNYVVLSPKFKPVRYIHTKTRGDLQKQGLEIRGKYILRVMNRYYGMKIRSWIYIYNMKGQFKKRVKIRTGSEVESIYFVNDRLYASVYVEKWPHNKLKRYSYIVRCK